MFQASCLWRGKTRGLVLGEYVVEDKIGQGGMGVVCKARPGRMDRVVALKTLPAEAMREAEAVQRFYREVRAAARLSHPNIVTAYDAGECQGLHYLVMEYVDGRDLATLVKEHGPLPWVQAVECVLQAARGLAYAHSQGVVHRDIQPGNLLVDRQGEGTTEEQLTGTGQVMGTCDYMAPEQAVSTHRVDHRADIYSLGCTLYRLLTGEAPYRGQTLVEVLLAHREAPIPWLRERRPDVPEELEGIFRRMVAKRPEEQYGTMEEVIGELEGVWGTRGAGGVPGEEAGEVSISAWLERISAPGGSGGQAEAKPAGVAAPGAVEAPPVVSGGAGAWGQTMVHGAAPETPTVQAGGAGGVGLGEGVQAAGKGFWRRLVGRLASGDRRYVMAAGVALAAVLVLAVGVWVARSSRPSAGKQGVEVASSAQPKTLRGKKAKEPPPAKPAWQSAWEEAQQQAQALVAAQEFGKAIAQYQGLLDRYQKMEL